MLKDEDLARHTLNLYAGDHAKLQALYPDIGAGAVIRRIVRKFLEQVEDKPVSIEDSPEVKL